jgi:acetyl esterase/lipase
MRKTSRRQSGHPLSLLKIRSMTMAIFPIALVAFLFACKGSDDDVVTKSEQLILNDVAYGTDPLQTLDLNLPPDRNSKTKVIVFIHGGGWREGSKEQFSSIIGKFVAQGFATVSINYRHADIEQHISYVELLEDIDQSLLFLRAKSGEYVYNPDDVCLFGHSAGAHLSLLYAYRNNSQHQVTSVISLSAPTNLRALLDVGNFADLLYNLVGSDDLSKFDDASPISHVSSGAVPTYCFHGLADPSVPYTQSQDLYDELMQKNSTANKLQLLENEGHDFSEEAVNAIVTESIQYLKQ